MNAAISFVRRLCMHLVVRISRFLSSQFVFTFGSWFTVRGSGFGAPEPEHEPSSEHQEVRTTAIHSRFTCLCTRAIEMVHRLPILPNQPPPGAGSISRSARAAYIGPPDPL